VKESDEGRLTFRKEESGAVVICRVMKVLTGNCFSFLKRDFDCVITSVAHPAISQLSEGFHLGWSTRDDGIVDRRLIAT
jgi:hypothetical protein